MFHWLTLVDLRVTRDLTGFGEDAMGFRNTLRDTLFSKQSSEQELAVRALVEEVLANRQYVMPGDHRALRQEVEALSNHIQAADSDSETGASTEALHAEISSLKKKLSMAMGAIQAATAQLAQAKQRIDANDATIRQVDQRTTSAQATAEAASDGVTGLEDALASLMERLGTSPPPGRAMSTPDLSVLDGTIGDLKKGLTKGSFDACLPDLLAAEQAGRARVGAIEAIKKRM